MALAVGVQQTGVQQTAAGVLPDAPQVQTPQQPQNPSQIPDAPKPQTTGLQTPGLGPIAPGKGTTATSNGESSGSNPTVDQDQPPSDGTQQPTKPMPDEVQDSAPELPQTGQSAYQLPSLTVRSVEIPFTVKDNKGRLVPGINWREVQVFENNVRQKIQVFTVDPYPLSVALVIDQSLNYDVMERVNNSLGALQNAFTPYDEVSVITYNNGPKMATDFTGGQSARLGAVIERSKAAGREPIFADTTGPLSQGIKINGDSQDHDNPLTGGGPGSPQGMSHTTIPREAHTLNDAILMAGKSLTKAAKGRRRVIYVISDGKEYGSTAKTKDVIRYLQTNKIEVIATLVGDSAVEGMGFVDTLHLPLMMRDNILPVYTKATGGEFYADYRTKGIESSFAKITEDARTQYTVWYNSREPMIDGKFRKVEVRVMRPHLQVIAKDGYYPAVESQATRPPVPPRPVSTNVGP
jgi:VWFA-related protein